MAVDEAGNHDVARRIDDVRTIGAQALPDLGDPFAVDEDIGIGALADRWILAQDDATADEDSVSHQSIPF
jgi:hypothetical protein